MHRRDVLKGILAGVGTIGLSRISNVKAENTQAVTNYVQAKTDYTLRPGRLYHVKTTEERDALRWQLLQDGHDYGEYFNQVTMPTGDTVIFLDGYVVHHIQPGYSADGISQFRHSFYFGDYDVITFTHHLRAPSFDHQYDTRAIFEDGLLDARQFFVKCVKEQQGD